jgi:AraC-like DNA-binding protein
MKLMGTMELAVVGLTGSGIGTALGVPLLWPRGGHSVALRLMGGWLLALSAVAAIISARVIGLLPPTAGVQHAINLLGFCAYPLLYLYVREQTGQTTRVRDAWWLWVPAIVYIVVLITRSAFGLNTGVPFPWILPVLLAFTALCASVLRHGNDQGSGIVPPAWAVVFLVLLNVAQIVRMLFGHIEPVRALVPLMATFGFVSLVALVMWRTVALRPAAAAAAPSRRYEKSGLDKDAAMALLARIEEALSANRRFADAALTLGGLADAVGCTPHQLSEVLNRYANVSFHELLNRRRVTDVKAQLLDPSADRYTIEGIGASAGFGSRSALYAAFRRLEGMTPAEFRAAKPAGISRQSVVNDPLQERTDTVG